MKTNTANFNLAYAFGISLISLTVLLSGNSYADWEAKTPNEKKGLEIATKSKESNTGWISSENKMEMVLINNHGEKNTRSVRARALEVKDDGDKSLSIFDDPRDVKGTAFLTFSHVDKSDDQWLYLPALKRVKRISSRNRSGPFMGSEFAFEDLSSFEIKKYGYEYIGEEMLGGKPTSKVKLTPQDKDSGYKYFYTWFSHEHFQPLKSEFYDRKGSLLKTLKLSNYKKFDVGVWRATQMNMENHQKKRRTELHFNDFKFDTGLKSSDFNKRKLKSLR